MKPHICTELHNVNPIIAKECLKHFLYDEERKERWILITDKYYKNGKINN